MRDRKGELLEMLLSKLVVTAMAWSPGCVTGGHIDVPYPFGLGPQCAIHETTMASSDISIILESIRDQLRLSFFMEIIFTICWPIWIMRNNIIFKNIAHLV
jgi:hypothetical protein